MVKKEFITTLRKEIDKIWVFYDNNPDCVEENSPEDFMLDLLICLSESMEATNHKCDYVQKILKDLEII